jgi:hypothetical protein
MRNVWIVINLYVEIDIVAHLAVDAYKTLKSTKYNVESCYQKLGEGFMPSGHKRTEAELQRAYKLFEEGLSNIVISERTEIAIPTLVKYKQKWKKINAKIMRSSRPVN